MTHPTILVVDDSPTSILWQRLILEGERYRVITARDGEEGVRTALAERPDLILMDVVMPNMNGIEACQLLRTNEVTARTPILMVTTRSEMQNVLAGFESGCNEYITKPIDRTELLAKVRSYIGATSQVLA